MLTSVEFQLDSTKFNLDLDPFNTKIDFSYNLKNLPIDMLLIEGKQYEIKANLVNYGGVSPESNKINVTFTLINTAPKNLSLSINYDLEIFEVSWNYTVQNNYEVEKFEL